MRSSTSRGREVQFEFTAKERPPGENWYYVRVIQDDGQMAWSSLICVRTR